MSRLCGESRFDPSYGLTDLTDRRRLEGRVLRQGEGPEIVAWLTWR